MTWQKHTSSWERVSGKRTDYIDVTRNEVIVGNHHGSGMTDMAGSCSHEDFLGGRFQDIIETTFGKETLTSVINAVKNAPRHEPFMKQAVYIAKIQDFLNQLPVDPTLAGSWHGDITIDGNTSAGNAGMSSWRLASTSTVLVIDKSTGRVEGPGGTSHAFQLPGWCTGVVTRDDHYHVISAGTFIVVSPRGEIVFNASTLNDGNLFGSDLRLTRVARAWEAILVMYRWFSPRDGKDGVLRFELGKGFVSRCDLDGTGTLA